MILDGIYTPDLDYSSQLLSVLWVLPLWWLFNG